MTDVLQRTPWVGAAGSMFAGGGMMGAMIRDRDWSASPLGPPQTWPQSLRSIVDLMLSSKFPMFVAWGPDLGFLYNDAYAELLGTKHPTALGRRFHDVWTEIWSDISPLIDKALAGEALWHEDLPLVMNRKGYDETAWFTFSYSPARDDSGAVAGMFCAVTETTEKVLAERRLVDDRERQRKLFEQAPGFIAILSGSDFRFEFVNEAYDRLFGRRGFVGRTVREMFPDLADQPFSGLLENAFATGERVAARANPIRLQAPDDDAPRDHFLDFICEPVRDDAGIITGLFIEGYDVTDAFLAREALRESEERLRFALDAGELGAWELDLATMGLTTSAHCRAHMGRPVDQSFTYDELRTFIHPDDLARQEAAVRLAIRDGGDCNIDYRVVWPDGQVRWINVRGRAAYDEAGRPVRMAGISADINHRMLADLHQRLLIDELNHRVKNTLATIQSIAMQTFRHEDGAGAPPEQRALFESRLIALAKVHDVLTRENWEGARLRDVVFEAVAAHISGDRNAFTIQGPDARLSPKMALSLSMALHELATNATKYGALSVPDGDVSISWTVQTDGDGRRLSLLWQESGGPPVLAPTRKGFGSRLIERQLARELRGEVALAYAPGGVTCTIVAPVTDIRVAPNPPTPPASVQ